VLALALVSVVSITNLVVDNSSTFNNLIDFVARNTTKTKTKTTSTTATKKINDDDDGFGGEFTTTAAATEFNLTSLLEGLATLESRTTAERSSGESTTVAATTTTTKTTKNATTTTTTAPSAAAERGDGGSNETAATTTVTVTVTTTTNGIGTVPIPANDRSRFVASDVRSIAHVPVESRIEVRLRSDRTCQDPYVLGRISGWSLSLVKFRLSEDHDDDDDYDDDDVLVGVYDRSALPVSGRYHLELIVLLCERYDHHHHYRPHDDETSTTTSMTKAAENRTTTGWINITDVVCLYDHGGEEEAHFRITDRDAFIDVLVPAAAAAVDDREGSATTTTTTDTGDESDGGKGQWIHKDLLAAIAAAADDDNNNNNNSTGLLELLPPEQLPRPIYTRYQADKQTVHAEKLAYKRYLSYTYRWNEPYADLNLPGLAAAPLDPGGAGGSNETQSVVRVCFVGSSHSRELNDTCGKLLLEASSSGLVVSERLSSCAWLKYDYPWDLTAGNVRKNLKAEGCTHAVVGLFQWYFSYMNYLWTTKGGLGGFADRMTEAVGLLAEAARDPGLPLFRRVVLRSAHPNGLGFRHVKCPPADRRTYPNAEIATSIVRDIAAAVDAARGEEAAVTTTFVDTRFLIDPVWDSQQDLSHYKNEIAEQEARFILREILMTDDTTTRTTRTTTRG